MPAGVNNKPVGNCAIIQIDEFLLVEIVRLQISCFKLTCAETEVSGRV